MVTATIPFLSGISPLNNLLANAVDKSSCLWLGSLAGSAGRVPNSMLGFVPCLSLGLLFAAGFCRYPSKHHGKGVPTTFWIQAGATVRCEIGFVQFRPPPKYSEPPKATCKKWLLSPQSNTRAASPRNFFWRRVEMASEFTQG